MVVELTMTFKDLLGNPDDELLEFSYTLNAPSGFEVTGGQLFVESVDSSDLERFSFRIDRDTEGTAQITILEDPNK